MRIRNFDVAERVLVIAEIGNNHEGKFDVAREMVHRAAESGAHAVKFQTFRTKHFVRKRDQARYERMRSFELTDAEFEKLHEVTHGLGLLFISTPLDLPSARFLRPLVDCYKVASGDNDFYPLLTAIAESGLSVIVSSGLSDMAQVRKSVGFLRDAWKRQGVSPDLAVLHCLTSYPAPAEQVNLAIIPEMIREIDATIGYSDHTLGIDACLAAVALGARIIEKHFTLDKNYSSFRDHQLSADPPELRELVTRIAMVSTLRGRLEKTIQPAETDLAVIARRSIVAAEDLPAGHTLTWQDLSWLRPADGLPPGEETRLLGRTLRQAIASGESILAEHVN